MNKMDRATADLMEVFTDATAQAERSRNALLALGVDPAKKPNGRKPAPARKARTKKDDRPLPERTLEVFKRVGSPTAAGNVARELHVSPAQAKAAARQLEAAGKLRVAGRNKREAELYEVVT